MSPTTPVPSGQAAVADAPEAPARRALDDSAVDMSRYFAGAALYGDDFDEDRIRAWHADEREAYAARSNRPAQGEYPYHAENEWLLFRHLDDRRFDHVVTLGGAYAEELLPLADRIGRATIFELSEQFAHDDLAGVPLRYAKPLPDGRLTCRDGEADLVTCFGVLHHLPNVSATLSEIARILCPGALALIKEPTVSMGDWRRPRPLTPHERGIPLHLFREIIRGAGLIVRVETRFNCQISRAFTRCCGIPWNRSRLGLRVDGALSRLTAFNRTYHATSTLQKIRPASVAYLLEKPER